MPESCNSRSLSWLVGSCIPKPSSDLYSQPGPVKGSEPASISSLPDDLLLECLSRVPLSDLPSLPSVSRRFSRLLSSPDFSRLRLPLLRPTLISLSSTVHFTRLDPPDHATCTLPFPLPHSTPVPIGRHVYLLSPRHSLLLDAWTLRSAPIPLPLFPRKKFAAASVGGRIYVAGGTTRTSAVEMYDPDLSAWQIVSPSSPVRHRYACFGAAAGDLFFVVGGLTLSDDSARAAHASAGTMDAFDVRTRSWVLKGAPACTRAIPGGGCAVGACGVGPHVYVVASNALELSFWRWSWEETKGGRRMAGSWSRLEPPPVGGSGGAVRFGCSAVGEDRMVAVVHVSSRGRGRRGAVEVGSMNGAVLVYDVTAGEWSRGPELPVAARSGVCSCVDC